MSTEQKSYWNYHQKRMDWDNDWDKKKEWFSDEAGEKYFESSKWWNNLRNFTPIAFHKKLTYTVETEAHNTGFGATQFLEQKDWNLSSIALEAYIWSNRKSKDLEKIGLLWYDLKIIPE